MTITTGIYLISSNRFKPPSSNISKNDSAYRIYEKNPECEVYAKKYIKCIEKCYFNWGHEIDCDAIQNKYNMCMSTKTS